MRFNGFPKSFQSQDTNNLVKVELLMYKKLCARIEHNLNC